MATTKNALLAYEVIRDEEYVIRDINGSDLYTMRREDGETPNGNPIAGRWVLRGLDKSLVAFDQYRNDIFSKFGIRVAPASIPSPTSVA